MQINPRPGNTGLTVEHDLKKTALAVVHLIYKGRYCPPDMQHLEIECEVYDSGDGYLSVHSVCPKCRHGLWIDGRNKKIEYDKDRGLFIEPFRCSWEMTSERQEFGVGLCRMETVYDGKQVKEV